VDEAAGCHVRDADGNVFLGFRSGAGVLALGRRIEYLPPVPGSCTRPPAVDRAGSRIAGFQPQLP
jgi:hypothetical protein